MRWRRMQGGRVKGGGRARVASLFVDQGVGSWAGWVASSFVDEDEGVEVLLAPALPSGTPNLPSLSFWARLGTKPIEHCLQPSATTIVMV